MELDQYCQSNRLEAQKTRFEHSVTSAFSFLEVKRGMVRKPIRVVDRSSPSDQGLIIRYEDLRLAVDVGWQVLDNNIGVIIRVRTASGRLSASDPNQYIYFEPYIEFLTNGRVSGIVPQMRSSFSQAQMASVMRERAEMQMESVIQELGNRLQQYQEEVLLGDTSRFREFHEWLGWDAWKLKHK